MNQLKQFSYEGSGIEFEIINGEVYANATAMFSANNTRLDHWRNSESTRRYIEAVHRNLGIAESQLVIVRKGGLGQQGTWIHEKLILNAARYCSVDFEIWCDERISEIITAQTTTRQIPGSYRDAVAALLAEIDAKEKMQAENDAMRPKADYADMVLSSESELTTTLIAKSIGMSAKKLNKSLNELGIQFKQSNIWYLYKRYEAQNYAKVRTHAYVNSKGEVKTKHYLVWTEEGRRFVCERMRNGYNISTTTPGTQLQLV